MIKKLKELHTLHAKDYIRFFDANELEYSIIVKTENISVISNNSVDLEELFDDYISINVTKELKSNIEFLNKSMNIKAEILNDVKLNCNLLIRYYHIQTFSIDNKVIYISNIDEETEKKIKLQEHYKRVDIY